LVSPKESLILYKFYVKQYWSKISKEEDINKTIQTLKLFSKYISDKEIKSLATQQKLFNTMTELIKKEQQISFIVPIPFNENTFNKNLENFLQSVSNTSDQIQEQLSFLPFGPNIILLNYLTKMYLKKANILKNTKLTGLEKHYQHSIKQVLNNLSKALIKKHKFLSITKNRIINKRSVKDNANVILGNYDHAMDNLTKTTAIYLSFDHVEKQGRKND
jgi:hypothetical protein